MEHDMNVTRSRFYKTTTTIEEVVCTSNVLPSSCRGSASISPSLPLDVYVLPTTINKSQGDHFADSIGLCQCYLIIIRRSSKTLVLSSSLLRIVHASDLFQVRIRRGSWEVYRALVLKHRQTPDHSIIDVKLCQNIPSGSAIIEW